MLPTHAKECSKTVHIKDDNKEHLLLPKPSLVLLNLILNTLEYFLFELRGYLHTILNFSADHTVRLTQVHILS